MFDLQATDGSVRKKSYKPPASDELQLNTDRQYAGNRLDKPDMNRLFHRLLDIYTTEIDRQFDNRMEMAEDADFYDNIQWKAEDAHQVEERGQVPIVYNVTSATIDWVTGTERRARTDFKVLPRRKEDSSPAQRKTELLKYLSDVNRSQFHESRAFEDAVKVGIGWMESGVQDEDEDEPIYDKYQSWRNILFDSAATELDLEDGRYMFRQKWLDLDVAVALFKKRKHILERTASENDTFVTRDNYGDPAMDAQEDALEQTGASQPSEHITGYQRRRVRVIEMWIKMPVEADRLRGGAFSGELYEPGSPGHEKDIDEGAEVRKKVSMRVHVAIFCTAGMLWFSRSPYRHNRFPFTPVWGYRRDRDGMPYGLIRRFKGIQEDINKRASKAQFLLATNRVIMDDDALPDDMDIDEFAEEAARPDAILRKRKGTAMEFDRNTELSQHQLELMSRDIQMIQQAGGVTDEMMGRKTNAQSGKAIIARQEQGNLATAKLFDNYRLAKQILGEKRLSLIEQFITEKKAFRITNRRGKPEFVEVNDGLPDNDIVRSKADFVIDEADWQATMRQAAVQELLEATGRLPPEIALILIDLVVENMDLPNREEIVKRIRAITGQRDPDQDEPTEEELAQQQAKAEADAMAKETAMAQLKKLTAEAEKLTAQAKQIDSQTVSAKIDALNKAIQAAMQSIAVPQSTNVADFILQEAGFESQSAIDAGSMPQAVGLNGQQAQLPPPPQQRQIPQQPGLMQ